MFLYLTTFSPGLIPGVVNDRGRKSDEISLRSSAMSTHGVLSEKNGPPQAGSGCVAAGYATSE
jgi:hypothetical protein